MSDSARQGGHHPEDERPRKEVNVINTSASASAEAVTQPVVGEDNPLRRGEVTFSLDVTIECLCGNEVLVGTIQRGVTCQGCARRWRLK